MEGILAMLMAMKSKEGTVEYHWSFCERYLILE